MSDVDVVTTVPVAVVGAGPAGLMLTHLLARAGIDSIAIDVRTREEIETTQRAGILEAGVAQSLVETGVSDRILHDGDEHAGTELRFGGAPIGSTSRNSSVPPCGSTRRRTSSSTWPVPVNATGEWCTSASATSRSMASRGRRRWSASRQRTAFVTNCGRVMSWARTARTANVAP